jgi:hypothetical protein
MDDGLWKANVYLTACQAESLNPAFVMDDGLWENYQELFNLNFSLNPCCLMDDGLWGFKMHVTY